MYKITKIRHVDRQHGTELANRGKRQEGLSYIREHTEVMEEFGTLLEARQFWRSLGMPAGANYHETDGMIYRLGVARTD